MSDKERSLFVFLRQRSNRCLLGPAFVVVVVVVGTFIKFRIYRIIVRFVIMNMLRSQ